MRVTSGGRGPHVGARNGGHGRPYSRVHPGVGTLTLSNIKSNGGSNYTTHVLM